jgi:uncharacterized surface protein with fasciclin (FAS1) repeats
MKALVAVALALCAVACDQASSTGSGAPAPGTSATAASNETPAATPAPLPTIPTSGPKNIVHVAMGSKDHTTLVAALQAADYVDSLTNPGPLTVFAPTNAAFDKLPKGTVESLLKPENVGDLRNILQYHVAVPVYELKDLKDGMVLGMANGAKATIHVKDGKASINDANIVGSVRASNGVVHVVDTVLLPPKQ